MHAVCKFRQTSRTQREFLIPVICVTVNEQGEEEDVTLEAPKARDIGLISMATIVSFSVVCFMSDVPSLYRALFKFNFNISSERFKAGRYHKF